MDGWMDAEGFIEAFIRLLLQMVLMRAARVASWGLLGGEGGVCAGGQAGRRVSRRGENQVGQADGHQLVCQCQRINQQLRRAAREGKGIGKGLGRGSANWVHHGHAERARRSKLVPSNISINSQQQQQSPTANSQQRKRTNERVAADGAPRSG